MIPIQFSAVLLKVASRCNLDCDYCYVYHHADQSWRDQPHFMSLSTVQKIASRIQEYVEARNLKEFSITFHGGEPLLFGAQRLAETVEVIRSCVTAECVLDFSLQTNGVLLTDEAIDALEKQEILISLSLDGDRRTNDRHRVDHSGSSSFEQTLSALQRLQRRKSKLFRGVIAVIDPYSDPRTLFEFFETLSVPRLDLLLPDATHARLPPHRDEVPALYGDWLEKAFDLWFREYPELPIRWFDALLATRLGVASPTDAMGLGSINLVVIDTDGTYTDHDVFKITDGAGPSLSCNVQDASLVDIERHPSIQKHAFHLTLDGLASECQRCPIVAGCGGGSVMHRWHPVRKLDAPTVYCRELFSIFRSATASLRRSLAETPSEPESEDLPLGGDALLAACRQWRADTEARADNFCLRNGIERGDSSAASILLRARQGLDLDAALARTSRIGTWQGEVRLHAVDPWLIAPFSDAIRVVDGNSLDAQSIFQCFSEATALMEAFDRILPEAFRTLISDVVFVESRLESEDRIFSLSDDSAPNVIYLSIRSGGKLLEPEDLADSLIHEFFHHILYHAEQNGRMLYDKNFPKFSAPWRPSSDLRPSGGFLHGTFVFSALARFWKFLFEYDKFLSKEKALENATLFLGYAHYGTASLKEFGLLTARGENLLRVLSASLDIVESKIEAPGIQA
jgi:uncharacterized protein